MKNVFLIVPAILLLFACQPNRIAPIEELKAVGLAMQQNLPVEYAYKSKFYRSYGNDTSYMRGKMYFEPNSKDSILGLNFYHTSRHSQNFYNGEYLISMYPRDSAIFKTPLIDYENGHMTVYPFLESSYAAIELFLTDSLLSSEIDSLVRRDTLINHQPHTYFSFWTSSKFVSTHKKFDKFNTKVELIVEKQSRLPRFYTQYEPLPRQNHLDFHYYETTFSNYSRDASYPPSMFTIESVPSYFQWDKYKNAIKVLPVNTPAPDWQLPEISEDSIRLSLLKGKTVLLSFWFIGCGACIESIPMLNDLHRRYEDENFEVIGINCFSKSEEKVKKYIADRGMAFRNVWQGDQISDCYKITAAPIFYLINKQGKIAYTQVGHDSIRLSMAVKGVVGK